MDVRIRKEKKVTIRQIAAVAVAATAALLPLSGCDSSQSIHDQKTVSIGTNKLTINVASSELDLVQGNGSRVQIQRWLSGTAAKPGHSMWSLNGDTLHLGINCSGVVISCGSRFQVAIPSNVSVLVHSTTGNVMVTGLPGSVVVDGSSGEVDVNNTSGPLQVSTTTGNITASGLTSPTVSATSNSGVVDIGFSAAPRSVNVKTNGNATVRVPANGHKYHIVATTNKGPVQTRVPDDRQGGSVIRVYSGNDNAKVVPA